MKRNSLRISLRKIILVGRFFRVPALLLTACSFLTFFVAGAWGAIPGPERTVLLNLYTSTTGSGWYNSANWNGVAAQNARGTE